MSRLADQSLASYLADLAARKSTPGGGAVAAIVAAEAAALISMAAGFTDDDRCREIATQAGMMIEKFLELADEDSAAFSRVMKAYRGKDTDEIEYALIAAAGVPVKVASLCTALIPDVDYLVDEGNRNLVTDTGIAAGLLAAALDACATNIRVNLREIRNPPKELLETLRRLPDTVSQCRTFSSRVNELLL